jgi:hypothetical protein
MSEMSVADPLGGTDGNPGASTTYVGDVDGGPLGGVVGDPGAPTTYVGDVDGRPPIPCGGPTHPESEMCVVNLHGYHRQK